MINPQVAFEKNGNYLILLDGPDIFFTLYDFDGDGQEEILATQFFSSKTVLYWGNWSDPSSIKSRVIDNTIGPPYAPQVIDLNYDGKVDVLISNHDGSSSVSAVFAYEIPKNIYSGTWKRHTLASGFITRESGVGQASPGEGYALYPNLRDTKRKPCILLSGDGSQQAYFMQPTSENPTNWNYNITVIVDSDSTVGQIAYHDLNDDGFMDFLVPLYNSNEILAFSFSN